MLDEMFYSLFSSRIRRMLVQAKLDLNELQEIRFRIACPVLVKYEGREHVLSETEGLVENEAAGYRISRRDLGELLESISGYSVYAFEEELRQGFLTVPGGHRIGIAGKAIQENGKITCIRYISFLNVRLSHQICGCADLAMPYLIEKGQVCSTLIISPPGSGKTTLLRDMIRQISNGSRFLTGRTVGVVDERSELAGAYQGVPQNDLGIRTDVLEGCSKAEGMMMLLRSMAPQVIAVDELGSIEDGRAVEKVFHCGCKLLATIHGAAVEEIQHFSMLSEAIGERRFERYIVLDGTAAPGTIREISDADGRILFPGEKEAERCS